MVIVFNGPLKPEACWSGTNQDECEDFVLTTGLTVTWI